MTLDLCIFFPFRTGLVQEVSQIKARGFFLYRPNGHKPKQP